ncbi:hypothetical protein CHS0354_011934 [Potamilus streckersoni]|uniref:HIT domain-containing protein n=1 Tax=Potamilus streckersoni TaxID=2493646 RepID=A0AAE0T037_9BIVA|nr:hypothetical protein CHS0354_011934 [Potamilus streckersoni]
MAATSNAKPKRKMKDDDSDGLPKKKPTQYWNQGLLSSIDDPELRVDADDKVVIIRDKYPKAKFHFLAMPKVNIPNLKSLKREHLVLLKHMETKGKEIAQRFDSRRQFRFGYHAVPSMSHLHMHIISQDFDSPSLKTKKHWNSFTTEYFHDSEDIINMLEKNGRVELDTKKYQELLKNPLKCHVCLKDLPNMPNLKQHIKSHDYSSKK